MKLYEHTIGRFRLRCRYKDAATVKDLFEQFVPAVLYHVFKMKSFDPKTTDLPRIHSLGFTFRDEPLTVFGEGTELLFLDNEGLKEAADKIG